MQQVLLHLASNRSCFQDAGDSKAAASQMLDTASEGSQAPNSASLTENTVLDTPKTWRRDRHLDAAAGDRAELPRKKLGREEKVERREEDRDKGGPSGYSRPVCCDNLVVIAAALLSVGASGEYRRATQRDPQ